ncbi:hypothetical protein LCGC14_0336820 [marine sediment metagenome]|uniref:Uncharacterized protein n=1 Tax=marine sediment metagenome TaxID=412755 RepID=A0A0F9TY08_9ZZZZ
MTTSNERFQTQLAFGKIAEQQIIMWLRRRCGYAVLPVYELEMSTGKGPQLFFPDSECVAPDVLAIRGEDTKWIEAKRKTVFTWHRYSRAWTTGIDRRHFREYQRIAEQTPFPVYLLFLHESSRPSQNDRDHNCPDECPSGLFGDDLALLVERVNHESDEWGSNGMVYWRHDDLPQIATLEEVQSVFSAFLKERRDKFAGQPMPGFED